jgi:hypothetical protein
MWQRGQKAVQRETGPKDKNLVQNKNNEPSYKEKLHFRERLAKSQ